MTASQTRRGNTDVRSDADVMEDVKARNSEALETLIGRYRGMIARVAAGILRDDGEAEDVTQDVFLEVYRRAHLYDPTRGTVRVWLLQYAYHRSLRRKAALRLRAAYRGEPLDLAEMIPTAHDRRLTSDECRWIVRAGLAQLPERQRTTLELAWLEELSLRDIAERLCVSLGCARHYYYRGLARLRAWAAAFDRAAPPQRRPTTRRASSKPRRAVSATDRADASTSQAP